MLLGPSFLGNVTFPVYSHYRLQGCPSFQGRFELSPQWLGSMVCALQARFFLLEETLTLAAWLRACPKVGEVGSVAEEIRKVLLSTSSKM